MLPDMDDELEDSETVDLVFLGDCLCLHYKAIPDGVDVSRLIAAMSILGNAGHDECRAISGEYATPEMADVTITWRKRTT